MIAYCTQYLLSSLVIRGVGMSETRSIALVPSAAIRHPKQSKSGRKDITHTPVRTEFSRLKKIDSAVCVDFGLLLMCRKLSRMHCIRSQTTGRCTVEVEKVKYWSTSALIRTIVKTTSTLLYFSMVTVVSLLVLLQVTKLHRRTRTYLGLSQNQFLPRSRSCTLIL